MLFLTIAGRINDISSRGVYEDLIRKFRDEGHDVYIATPTERRNNERTSLSNNDGVSFLRIHTLNITQTNPLEKGAATLLIEKQFKKAISKYFHNVRFDLILYSTPPVTFAGVIKYIKHRDSALSYLLLKDIFPQNAIDLGMIKREGILHRHFRKKEKELYSVSDFIGCMSPANVDFILKNNPEINPEIVEVNPNSIDPLDSLINHEHITEIKEKYKIPGNVTTFIYGGNFGKPQGIDFLLGTLNSYINDEKVFFVLAGAGTDYSRLGTWVKERRPNNVLLLYKLPKHEFDLLLQSGDVGMIFLDKRFTIPNFPSRLLSYLECKIPVIAATDKNTDLVKIMQENNFGLWSESGDLEGIRNNINRLSLDNALRLEMGRRGYEYLKDNYTVEKSYSIIMKHL